MLGRIIYLSTKKMSTISNDIIILTSSLTKDMTGKEDSHQGTAVRAIECLFKLYQFYELHSESVSFFLLFFRMNFFLFE